ncbi:MAG: hypothetical protein KatS3mg076_2205 [Candidatus Binatia bacterium]|nr:MAG: hypothetical protein KatS3mg076_2205 [Candidatus Binatia bacterium]
MTIDTDFRLVRHLADGTPVRFRLLVPEDREALRAGFERLSPESRYRRFFSPMPRLSEKFLDYLTRTDNENHLAVVAERLDENGNPCEGLGVARFVRSRDDPTVAEAAVAVVDEFQGRGVGTLLLWLLTCAALERGITKFRGYVLADNEGTRAFLDALVEHPEIRFDGGTLLYEVALPASRAPASPESGIRSLLRLAARGLELSFREGRRSDR